MAIVCDMRFIMLAILFHFAFADISGQITDSGTRYAEEEIQVQDLYILANQKKILQKYDEAIKIYSQILKKNEVSPAVHHDMARIYNEMGKKEQAIASGLKATKYEPDNPWYLISLAQMYEEAIEPQKAADAISKVIRLSPSEDLYNRWAINLEHAGQKEQSIQAYNRADQQYGWSLSRSDSKVDLYLSLGKDKDALAEVKRWPEQSAYDVEAWIRLARFYEYRGDQKKALKTYEKVLSLDPNNEEALFKSKEKELNDVGAGELGAFINDNRVNLDKKIAALFPRLESDAQSILPYCLSLTNQYPEDAKVYAFYGDALWLSDDPKGAAAKYELSLEKSKSVYQVWSQLMEMLKINQDFDKLHDVAEEAIDYYPNQAGPYHYQAVALVAQGELEDAADANEEASFIAGDDQLMQEDIAILSAQILVAQGDMTGAIESIISNESSSNSASMLELLGDLYFQSGDRTKAAEAWKKALMKGGGSDRISSKIDSL